MKTCVPDTRQVCKQIIKTQCKTKNKVTAVLINTVICSSLRSWDKAYGVRLNAKTSTRKSAKPHTRTFAIRCWWGSTLNYLFFETKWIRYKLGQLLISPGKEKGMQNGVPQRVQTCLQVRRYNCRSSETLLNIYSLIISEHPLMEPLPTMGKSVQK